MQNFKNHYELYKALIEGKTIGNDYGTRIRLNSNQELEYKSCEELKWGHCSWSFCHPEYWRITDDEYKFNELERVVQIKVIDDFLFKYNNKGCYYTQFDAFQWLLDNTVYFSKHGDVLKEIKINGLMTYQGDIE